VSHINKNYPHTPTCIEYPYRIVINKTQSAAAAVSRCWSGSLGRAWGRGGGRQSPRPLPSPGEWAAAFFFSSFAAQVARRCWPRGVTRRRPHRERVARLRPSGLSTFFPVAQPFCELLYLFLSHFLILVYRNFEEIQIQFFIFYFFRKFTMCNLPYLFINYSPIAITK
jgi:hypothetical protein